MSSTTTTTSSTTTKSWLYAAGAAAAVAVTAVAVNAYRRRRQATNKQQAGVAPQRVFVNPYANARALTADELATIELTVPFLRDNGVTLTTNFYKRMFAANPQLKHIFNQTHQATGMQPRALAGAVYAYAANINNLGVLGQAVAIMAHKHCSLDIRPDQYPIVGENLLAELRHMLVEAGMPAETIEKIIAAWAVAYAQLANILITTEENLYRAAESKVGGWRGWRSMVVRERINEADGMVSFILAPKDGGRVPTFEPGQYICLRALLDKDSKDAYYQPRQYSLSHAPGAYDGKAFRITCKRDEGHVIDDATMAAAKAAGCPFAASQRRHAAGRVSNLLHESFAVGTEIEAAAPFGEFCIDTSSSTPLTLIGAGVGVTPLMSMMEAAQKQGREVAFVYGAHDGKHHPFKQQMKGGKTQSFVFYSQPSASDRKGVDYDAAGRMDLTNAALPKEWFAADRQYYVCGPDAFMQEKIAQLKKMGVKADNIHCEMFGSGMLAQ